MIEIQKAVQVLERNIATICTIREWADAMNYSDDRYFSRKFRNHFGERPKEMLKKIKLAKFKDSVRENPNEIFYCIAKQLGFADDQALYKFVKRHTGKSLTSVKRECEKGV